MGGRDDRRLPNADRRGGQEDGRMDAPGLHTLQHARGQPVPRYLQKVHSMIYLVPLFLCFFVPLVSCFVVISICFVYSSFLWPFDSFSRFVVPLFLAVHGCVHSCGGSDWRVILARRRLRAQGVIGGLVWPHVGDTGVWGQWALCWG